MKETITLPLTCPPSIRVLNKRPRRPGRRRRLQRLRLQRLRRLRLIRGLNKRPRRPITGSRTLAHSPIRGLNKRFRLLAAAIIRGLNKRPRLRSAHGCDAYSAPQLFEAYKQPRLPITGSRTLTCPPIRGLNKPVDKEMPLVINWHILEACNFGCRHCFAEWHQGEERCEPVSSRPSIRIASADKVNVYKDPENTEKLLAALMKLPSIVPPPSGKRWSERPRLSIAGGEPFLALKKGHLERILEEAHSRGFDLSIISNGFLIPDEFIEKWASRLAVLGISLDSGSLATSRKIGRCTKKGEAISVERIAQIREKYKMLNPKGAFKVNTVVNTLNWDEDMSKVIQRIGPDKWKILRILPVADTDEKANEQKKLEIEGKQFQHFCSTHEKKLSGGPVKISAEDNDLMSTSYVMVNPHGKFYWPTEKGDGSFRYAYSKSILEVGVEKAFAESLFSSDSFSDRYQPMSASHNTPKCKPIIFVGGVHGVGKSTACDEVCPPLGIALLGASSLIEQGFQANGVHKAVEEADKRIPADLALNQEMLAQGFRKSFKPNHKHLFAGHFVLATKAGTFVNVPEETFQEISPLALVVCLNNVDELKRRASGKKGLQQYSARWWHEFQEKEKLQASRMGKKLGIPCYEIQLSNTRGFHETVKNIFNMKN